MSHFTKIKTTQTDRDRLAEALRDLYPDATVETGDRITIAGYNNGRTTLTAIGEVAVRRVGVFGEDIGYSRQPDGTLARVSDTYTEREHAERLGRIAQRYAYHNTIAQARRLGFRITNESTQQTAAPVVQRAGR